MQLIVNSIPMVFCVLISKEVKCFFNHCLHCKVANLYERCRYGAQGQQCAVRGCTYNRTELF